jgi:hypothetical protein
MAKLMSLLGCVLVVCLGLGTALAQEVRSLPIRITTPDVQLRRDGAQNTFSIRQDAIAVIGTGDVLMTDRRGRALVSLDEDTLLLIMPESTVEIRSIVRQEAQLRLEISLTAGHVLLESTPDSASILHVHTPLLEAEIDGRAAVWSAFEDGDVLTSDTAAIRYILHSDGESGFVTSGGGVYVTPDGAEGVQMRPSSAYLHAAQLIGLLRGCPARVVRTGQDALNLRVAPSLNASVIGYFDANGIVTLMGTNNAGTWRRIQRFSGFGWVSAAYVENVCQGLVTFPDNRIERNLELVQVQPRELAILTPFYGTTEQNRWVYRSFRRSPYGEE